MNTMVDLLKLTGICPILASAESDMAVPAAQALMEGGLPVLEVLMRDENSMQNMENIAKAFPDFYVGAGTVLSCEQAEEAIDRGAKFIVLPGFSRKIVETCLKRGVTVVPGAVTATEIMTALEYGIQNVKFFPVYQLGGVDMLAQLNGPYPNVKFVVTGGLGSNDFLPLVKYPGTLAAGGDWMFADGNALKERNYEQITTNMRHSIYKVLDMRAESRFK